MLSVKVDDKSKLSQHLDYISQKNYIKVRFLQRITNNRDLKITRITYNAIVTPHLGYCYCVLILCNECQKLTTGYKNRGCG